VSIVQSRVQSRDDGMSMRALSAYLAFATKSSMLLSQRAHFNYVRDAGPTVFGPGCLYWIAKRRCRTHSQPWRRRRPFLGAGRNTADQPFLLSTQNPQFRASLVLQLCALASQVNSTARKVGQIIAQGLLKDLAPFEAVLSRPAHLAACPVAAHLDVSFAEPVILPL
jgi:hypothetical protein